MATAAITVGGAAARPASGHIQTAGPAVNVTLDDGGVGGSSWQWTVVFAPAGTTAALSSAIAKTPTYGPLDQPGTYHLRLQVDGAVGSWLTDAEVDEVVIRVRPVAGVSIYIPAVEETTQAGSQGWAGETDGMNATLAYLTALLTLQGAYDNSSPKRILVAPAGGPVDFLRDPASHGDALRVGDTATLDRVVLRSDGMVAITKAILTGGGDVALDVQSASEAAGDFLFRARDSAGTSYVTVGYDGAIAAVSNGAGTGFSVNAKNAVSFVFSFQDSVVVGQFRMRPDGQMEWSGNLAAGEEALSFEPLGIHQDSKIFEVVGSSADGWAMYGDGRIVHLPEDLVVNTTASVAWYKIDLASMTSVLAGEERQGFLVDASAVTVASGGWLYGYEAIMGNVLGTSGAFMALVANQDIPAYRVGLGSGAPGSAFTGYDHFCAADMVAEAGFVLTINTPSGTGTHWTATAGTEKVAIPIHAPPGSLIQSINVRVNKAGASQMSLYLMQTNDTGGASGALQTQIANQASVGGAGPQDITIAVPGYTVPSVRSGTQPALFLIVASANAGDEVYAGRVVYDYTDLQHGD